MKKQMLSLILSTSIFATSSLFAMEFDEKNSQGRIPVPAASITSKTLKEEYNIREKNIKKFEEDIKTKEEKIKNLEEKIKRMEENIKKREV